MSWQRMGTAPVKQILVRCAKTFDATWSKFPCGMWQRKPREVMEQCRTEGCEPWSLYCAQHT